MPTLRQSFQSAVRRQDSKALHRNLDIYAKEFPGLPINEFFLCISNDMLKLTCQDFLTQTPITQKKYQQILWLKEELKQSPFMLSVMMAIAYINSYTGDLDNASKLYRNILIQYTHLLNTTNIGISDFNSWGWLINYSNFSEPRTIDIKPFPLPKLIIPDGLPKNVKTGEKIITAYGNAPYIMRFAERFVSSITTHIGSDVNILLVAADADEVCKNHCQQLQQAYPQLHVTFETIPDNFKNQDVLSTYCSLRRFTYIDDIFEAIGDHCLITLDLDLFINQDFKIIVDKVIDAPFGFYSSKNDIFSSENIFGAGYVIFNNSAIAQRIRYHLNDYLRKKLQTGNIDWVIDQYALFHALQCANLTKQERASCYNISDAFDNIAQFHFGTSEQETLLYQQEREEKAKDTRFFMNIKPKNIIFDKETLCPIIR
ncbi:MAG: hypothetical protein K0U39_02090 [Alphaproteobacteria bacterium]|nr:hypothetical protein [Alphaproteobacteria bacterium]